MKFKIILASTLLISLGVIAKAESSPLFSYSTDAQLMSEVVVLGALENGLVVYSWQWNEQARSIHVNYGASESDNGYAAIGFKAQEIQAHYPEAVFINDSGYLQIDASVLALYDEFIGHKLSGVSNRCARVVKTRFSMCF
ncbi:tail fiber domain-containing protein [Reinekea forsetii]|uniref:tail fiber domain-containing protein n=1 Tax=Reinekea forsetii TaxID=1336806 RepID=UPI00235641D0|nr:hypothetical protein [Reinekea forsetii]